MSLAFQWLQELKEKKRAQAKAALGVRKSPRSHSIKVFYGESTALEEEKKEASRPKLCSPPKKPKMKSPLKKLCRTVSLETVLGLKPNSSQIWFLDFFGFSLLSLVAPSTLLISLMHTCITSALNRPMSPCDLVPFGMFGHWGL